MIKKSIRMVAIAFLAAWMIWLAIFALTFIDAFEPVLRAVGLVSGGRYQQFKRGGNFDGGTPCMSPDGSTIVYSSPRSGHGDLYMVNRDGSNTRRITNDPNYEGEPVVSPDGKLIAFSREHDYIPHIWIMNVDGTEQRQLTKDRKPDFPIGFTAEGSSIIFTRVVERHRGMSYKVGFDGKPASPLFPGRKDDVVWSAEDGYLCYSSWGPPEGTYVMNEDGSNRRFAGATNRAHLSPDGIRLVFADDPNWESLWLVDSDGKNRKEVYRSRGYKAQARFTSDGGHILFLSEFDGRGVGDICIVGADGSNPERITSTK